MGLIKVRSSVPYASVVTWPELIRSSVTFVKTSEGQDPVSPQWSHGSIGRPKGRWEREPLGPSPTLPPLPSCLKETGPTLEERVRDHNESTTSFCRRLKFLVLAPERFWNLLNKLSFGTDVLVSLFFIPTSWRFTFYKGSSGQRKVFISWIYSLLFSNRYI